jgi:7-cyano-7-deazaguanine synthase
MTKAVVLHSGGQDSTTCLAWAIREYGHDNVTALSIEYGQRHHVELEQAAVICDALGVRAVELRLRDLLGDLAGGALTDPERAVQLHATDGWQADHDLPSTFIPGRNLLFFTAAAAYGIPRGCERLVTGVCEADRAGYPDCRAGFVDAAEEAIALAMDTPNFLIDAPLLELDKAGTWLLAETLGVLGLVVEQSHTCYQGDRSKRYAWGYGCGECPACTERATGFGLAFPMPVQQ